MKKSWKHCGKSMSLITKGLGTSGVGGEIIIKEIPGDIQVGINVEEHLMDVTVEDLIFDILVGVDEGMVEIDFDEVQVEINLDSVDTELEV